MSVQKIFSRFFSAGLLLSLLLALPMPAAAVEFKGLDFPDKIKLKGSRAELQLNGIGTRTKFFFDIYIGALYVRDKSSSAQIIDEAGGPNRILMHFLYEEVERQKLIDAWNEGFQNNTDAATLAKLEDRIKQFNDYFPTLRQGDVVILDYVPKRGTRINIKGNEVGVIKGADFNKALRNIWLGAEPADEDLKEAMLGL